MRVGSLEQTVRSHRTCSFCWICFGMWVNKLNRIDTMLGENDLEVTDEVIEEIRLMLTELNMRSQIHSDFIMINIYILKRIFFDFYFFNGFGKFVESGESLEYENLIKHTNIAQSGFSGALFKFLAYAELVEIKSEGVGLIERHVEFYNKNSQLQNEYILIQFLFYYTSNGNPVDINQSYYQEYSGHLLANMNEDEGNLRNLVSLTIEKYERLKTLIELFSVDPSFSDKDLRLLKVLYLQSYNKQQQAMLRLVPDFKMNCYMFNEEAHLQNHELLENKFQRLRNGKGTSLFFKKLKRINVRAHTFDHFDGKYFVLKFNSTSSGYQYRYFRATKLFFAVVQSKDKDRQFLSVNQKGVCKLTRSRARPKGRGFWHSDTNPGQVQKKEHQEHR